jgi:hypothetical protein
MFEHLFTFFLPPIAIESSKVFEEKELFVSERLICSVIFGELLLVITRKRVGDPAVRPYRSMVDSERQKP